MITLIAAVGLNNVIGGENKLLWQQKSDLAYFKAQTLHKPIIMGRKTFESLGRALPHRLNIVLTHQPLTYKNTIVTNTLEKALQIANAPEIMIIGGAQIYEAFMPLATRLLITQINTAPKGDAFFPEINSAHWQLTQETPQAKQEGDEYDMVFRDYVLNPYRNSPICKTL